jgi:hypothetical protein
MKKNLVLTSIHKLNFSDLSPFFDSLKKYSSSIDVCAFCGSVNPEIKQRIKSCGSQVQHFSYFDIRSRQPLLMFWPILRPIFQGLDFSGKCQLAKRVFHIMGARFVHYYEYLTLHWEQYDYVMLTDSRDVYFQRDPFQEITGGGVHVYLEADSQRIGTCRNNIHMVANTYGREILEKMHNYPVSCAGTIIGNTSSMLLYLREMILEMSRAVKMVSGSDQAAHNYIVHNQLVDDIHVHDNYTGSVFTAGCEPALEIRQNAEGEVIRKDGLPYPILHQYDRHSCLRETINNKVIRDN